MNVTLFFFTFAILAFSASSCEIKSDNVSKKGDTFFELLYTEAGKLLYSGAGEEAL